MPTDPRDALLAELREHALVIGEVTLSSGQTAQPRASPTSTEQTLPRPITSPGIRANGRGACAQRSQL